MQQTSGDFRRAMQLAAQELQSVKKQAEETERVIARVTRVRQGPALPPGGLIRPPSGPGPNGPFTTPFGGVQGLPVMARPETARGIGRTQAAMFSLAFTIGNLGEQLATAETKWQKVDRAVGTALQTIASVAVFFGPTGLLVAGVAVAGNFLSSFWTQQREEADRTARAWEDSLKRLTKSRDIGGAGGIAQELFSGPGGMQDLQAQIAMWRARRDEWEKTRTGAIRQSSMATATANINRLQEELDKVTEKHREAMAVVGELAKAEGQRADTAMRVAKWQQEQQTIKEAPAREIAQLQGMLQLEQQLAETRQFSARDAHALLDAYRDVELRLSGMSDHTSTIAREMRQALADAQTTSNTIAIIQGRGVLPGVGVTPQAPTPMKPFDIKIPELERMPVTLGQQIRTALQPMVDAIKTMSGYLISAGLSMLSRYGGAVGGGLASIGGGIVAGAQVGGPWGAVIGGVVGLADAIFSFGQKAKEARKAVEQFQVAFNMFVLQQQLALGDISDTTFQVEQLKQAFDAQREAVRQSAEAEKDAISTWTTRWHKDKRKAEIDAAAAKRIEELNELERRRIEQLEKEAKGLNEMTEAAERFRNVPSWFKVNLEVWRAANEMPIGGGGGGRQSPIDRRRRGIGRRGATTEESVVQIGTMTINTRAANGKELLKEFMAELKRQGLATFGAGEEARILGTL